MESADCVVIGAGVVGLAIARRLAMTGREVIVLEREASIGAGISSRNSEVIHAGIYYPPGSLKARLCVEGKQALYAFCRSHSVPHDRVGKLIVATSEGEEAELRQLMARAVQNGVHDLRWLDRDKVAAMEPALECRSALLSPSTGTVDSHALMLAYLGDAEAAGAVLALETPVTGGRIEDGRVVIRTGEGPSAYVLACRTVVLAAGLGTQRLSAALDGLPSRTIPTLHFGKGKYYVLSGRAPFRRLVYPAPPKGTLGIHFTRDMGGQGKFGPDLEYVDREDYGVDPAGAAVFYASIRRYWPGLPDGALQPGYAGIRPKLHGPESGFADFVIQGPDVHGARGLIALYGIESPGLTSSLAIADHVAGMLGAAQQAA